MNYETQCGVLTPHRQGNGCPWLLLACVEEHLCRYGGFNVQIKKEQT